MDSPSTPTMSSTSSIIVPTSAATQPLKEFALFPDLPQELQDQIWKASLPGPRLVTIYENTGAFIAEPQEIPNIPRLRETIRAICEPPVLLQVCTKSRIVAAKDYKVAFQQVLSRPVFFNFAVDILHFPGFHPFYTFNRVATYTYSHPIEARRVHKVAMPHVHISGTAHTTLRVVMKVISKWHNVKEIYLVSYAFNGPINGFLEGYFKELLSLHRGIVTRGMTDKEKRDWVAPAVFFLREEDLERMFG